MSCQNCSTKYIEYASPNLKTWCTNCGNYGIAAATKRALVAEGLEPHQVLLCYDIGCNGNGSDKIGGYRFHGLHGRVIPFAAGASLANNKVKVVASAGDGATLSEGINHLIHAIRNDYNVTFLLHNNANYALTTGQASVTTSKGVRMTASPDGPSTEGMNVMELVLSLNPSFAARTFSGDIHHMTETIQAGLRHQGFAFIEILQNCPTFNHQTTHEWYLQHTEKLGGEIDDLEAAKIIAADITDSIALGVLYKRPDNTDFYSSLANRQGLKTELVNEVRPQDLTKLIADLT